MPGMLRCDDDLRPIPPFVGKREDDPRRPITLKEVQGDKGKVRQCWESIEPDRSRKPPRPTPSTGDVERISGSLRDEGDPEGLPASRLAGRRCTADLRWLMERCMTRATCRRSEVAELGIDNLWKALAEEGIVDAATVAPDAFPLDAAAGDEPMKERIRSGLDRLLARGRKRIKIPLLSKGRPRKEREISFPIELVMDLLEVGAWDARQHRIRERTGMDPRYRAPRNLFLSANTGLGLKPGSIGDVMKDAFTRLGVRGSGHRLRAKAGLDRAAQLLKDRTAENGFVVDQGVLDWVLEQLRDEMGHKDIDTTLRYYVRLMMLEYMAPENDLVRRDAESLRRRIGRLLADLSPRQLGDALSMLQERFARAGGA